VSVALLIADSPPDDSDVGTVDLSLGLVDVGNTLGLVLFLDM